MDQQYVNNKPNRNSSGKTISSSSLSTASLSSSSSTSSPNMRQSQSFVHNNNSKLNNYNSNNSNSNGRLMNNNNSTGEFNSSNKRSNNQSSNNFNSSSNVSSGRKQNFNGNKGLKNRHFYDNNNNNFSSYYGNVSYGNESNTYEANKKKSTQNTTSKLTTSNFENEENTQKKYKERKSQQSLQYKDVMNQSKKVPFNTQSSESGSSSIGGVPIVPTLNLNYKYQPPPFQPPAYHQNNKMYANQNNKQNFYQNNAQQFSQKNKLLLEKYDRKYNLISFILLRKKDEYLVDNKYLLNDQNLYQKIDSYIEKKQLKILKKLFLNKKLSHSQTQTTAINQNLANFTNSYNCNIFVYTIRKCLETLSNESSDFINELIKFLFRKNIRPYSFYLIDGDYPKRNLMHYAARYNFELIPHLLLECFKEKNLVNTENVENLEKTVVDKDDEEKLHDLIQDDSCIVNEAPLIKKPQTTLNSFTEKNILNFNNGQFVFAQLCMQIDFNENTPIHLACQNDSYEFFKLVNPICIQHSQLLFNEDGLNPFLLASRHSSVKFIRHLVQSIQNSTNNLENINELKSLLIGVDKIYSKNCLHYACGRGCGKDALDVVKYLTCLAHKLDKHTCQAQVDINNNDIEIIDTLRQSNSKPIFYHLIGSVSPLVGSVYHVAASNLTRLTTLWYLLNLYPINGIFLDNLDKTSILDKLDFREFTTVDCLIDSVMNLREMAPPNYKSLSQFYNELLKRCKSVDDDKEEEGEEFEFDVLLKRCFFKMLVDFKVKIFNLPRIRNQLQLIEFLKIVVFMSKLIGEDKESIINFSSRFDFCSEYKNFEGFCLNFLNTFIFNDFELIPIFQKPNLSESFSNQQSQDEKRPSKTNQKSISRNNSTSSNNSVNSKLPMSPGAKKPQEQTDPLLLVDEFENLVAILTEMCHLADVIFFSNVYTQKFQIKLYTLITTYLNSLISYLNSNTLLTQLPTNDSNQVITQANDHQQIKFTQYNIKLDEIKSKINNLNPEKNLIMSLKNMCRISINNVLYKKPQNINFDLKSSALSKDYCYFKLPVCCDAKMLNFLTFNLIQDLYGTDFDTSNLILVEE